MPNLFTFASKNEANIQIGFEKRLWAVATVSSSAMRGRITKARKYLKPGSYGLLYCNPRQSFTVPFIVTSEADPNKVVSDIWPEPWVLPFSIEPLGCPIRMLGYREAMQRWHFLSRRMSEQGYNSVSAAMNFTGACVFSPLEITENDWETILKDLSH